jgi:hypothetical protein
VDARVCVVGELGPTRVERGAPLSPEGEVGGGRVVYGPRVFPHPFSVIPRPPRPPPLVDPLLYTAPLLPRVSLRDPTRNASNSAFHFQRGSPFSSRRGIRIDPRGLPPRVRHRA